MLAFADIACEHRLAHQPQRKLRLVPDDLPVKRRLAIDEVDGETELFGKEHA
ncbi:hypothetical protein D3C87_2083340 [compost metagenome]